MDRSAKENFVATMKEVFSTSGVAIVAQNAGLSVSDMNQLRNDMRDAGGNVKVIKNRLTKIALKDTPLSELEGYLNGPSLIAYSNDPLPAPKVAIKFANENENFVVVGGALPDKKMDLGEVKHLASLPSLDELRSKIVGLISAPANKLATLMNTPGSNLARVVKSYPGSDKAA